MESAEKDTLISESLFEFLKSHVPSLKKDDIDEVILSYVVSLLEDLAEEKTEMTREEFEENVEMQMQAESLIQTIHAYIPETESKIRQDSIVEWVLDLSKKMSALDKPKETNQIDLKNILEKNTQQKQQEKELQKVQPKSFACGGGGGGKKAKNTRRNKKMSSSESSNDGILNESQHQQPKRRISTRSSETSDLGSDSGFELDDFQQTVDHLLEMFPYSCSLEVNHCLNMMAGDIEQTAQLIMHRHETNQSLKPSDKKKIVKASQPVVDEKQIKDRIMGRYGFVDQDEDKRYHRPVVKKQDDKKMTRYRDGKIVSTKGERFTQVSKSESEEMKKSIVSPLNNNNNIAWQLQKDDDGLWLSSILKFYSSLILFLSKNIKFLFFLSHHISFYVRDKLLLDFDITIRWHTTSVWSNW